MRRSMICLLVLPLALAGCEEPAPVVPPGAMLVEGTVVETRGYCHQIKASNGALFSVHYGQLRDIKAGERVRIIGEIAAVQDCPGSKVLKLLQRAERI